MRPEVDAAKVQEFMRELGRSTSESGRVYLVGGGTAVLHGWRATTSDLDIKFVSEVDLGPVLSDLKQRLNLNIELASPDLFIPPLPGWEERSEFIRRERKLDFFHFDLYSQALAKIERGFDRDLDDVAAMIKIGGVDRARLLGFFLAIKPELNHYPALDPSTFEQAVRRVTEAE